MSLGALKSIELGSTGEPKLGSTGMRRVALGLSMGSAKRLAGVEERARYWVRAAVAMRD